MNQTPSFIRDTHRLLSEHAFYGMILSSVLACALLVGRLYLTQQWRFLFMIWNLFLAWIPYICTLGCMLLYRRYPRRAWMLFPFMALWLLFLPNAPYLVTDLVHFRYEGAFPGWYDLVMFATFAWCGCFLGVASLRGMQEIVGAYMGRLLSWLFVMGVCGLCGFGIYLGRFLRWNSWDLLVDPHQFLARLLVTFQDPAIYKQVAGITVLFAALLLSCYVTLLPNRGQFVVVRRR